MNVGELKAALDDYGDHVQVVIVRDSDHVDEVFTSYDVDYRDLDMDEGVVAITFEA